MGTLTNPTATIHRHIDRLHTTGARVLLTHTYRERERKREKEQNMIMVQKKLMMIMMTALLAACALATSATAMNTTAIVDDPVPLEDIPTDLVLRKLSWSGGEWSYESPWGGEWSGSWGDGGSAQSTPPAQYCTCGGCSQHVYLPPGNNYCAPSRQWCYFDVQDNPATAMEPDKASYQEDGFDA